MSLFDNSQVRTGYLPGDYEAAQVANKKQVAIIEIQFKPPRVTNTGIGSEGELFGAHQITPSLDLARDSAAAGLGDVTLVGTIGELHPACWIIDLPDPHIPAFSGLFQLRLPRLIQHEDVTAGALVSDGHRLRNG